MKIYGNVNFQQNVISEASFQLDSAFPVSPIQGQIVFKDKILYICTEVQNGTPIWVPLTREITSYTHIQSEAAATWNIYHNLNTTSVQVMVYNTNNRVVMADDIEIVDSQNATVYLTSAMAGKAVVLTGSMDGTPLPTYAYEFYQTTPASTWVITHSLGRFPIVRAFIGNQEVQPSSVVFDNSNQVTLTFATAVVGQAKLI